MSSVNTQMKSYEVLGYTNPLGSRSVPLVTIIRESKKEILALWPAGNMQRIIFKPGQKYSDLKTFLKATDIQDINLQGDNDEQMYSYINATGDIFTTASKDMLTHILDDIIKIKRSGNNDGILDDLIQLYNKEADTYNINPYNKHAVIMP